MDELSRRRSDTRARIAQLQERLTEAEKRSTGKACVYATGSFGRGEASSHSDLDLFIVGKADDRGTRVLKRLDEICIKADLIEVTRELHIPEFSGDGRYLEHYTVQELTRTLGTPDDDSTNTFTARLLLLLESCPLLENGVYDDIIGEVVVAYWRDYEDHKNEFMPAFLANDILRLWRTFCVNYEARTARVPDEEKAKGKLKNYKLKHSRLLTCYSALLHLLAVYRESSTVSPGDAIEMVHRTPTERLEWLLQRPSVSHAHEDIQKLLDQYGSFLEVTNANETQLLERFLDKAASRKHMTEAYAFGDAVYAALNKIGSDTRFYRLMVV